MRHAAFLGGILTVSLFAVTGCHKEEPTQTPVYGTIFADPNLDRVVRNAIRKPEGDLTPADVQDVQRLYAGYGHIRNLSGIEYMTSLQRLEINGNQIESLTPLGAVTSLDTLSVTAADSTDCSPLGSLTNLRWLLLDGVTCRDFSALSDLNQLQYLRVWGCSLASSSFLSGFTALRQLELWNTSFTELSGLSSLDHLVRLSIRDGSPQDIGPIGLCASLEYLELRDLNSVSDVTPLASLASLDSLSIYGVPVADWAPIATLENLVWLAIEFGSTDVAPLVALNRLTSLTIRSEAVPTLPALSGLPSLSTIYVYPGGWNGGEINCDFLATLPHLQFVHMRQVRIDNLSSLGTAQTLHRLICYDGCSIPNYSDLADLTHLTYLEITETPTEWPIFNLAPVGALANLDTLKLAGVGAVYSHIPDTLEQVTYVQLKNNSLTDVGFISSFPNIQWLDISDNQIISIARLASDGYFGAGDYLDVRGNPLSELSRTSYIPSLRSRGVNVIF